MHESYSALIPVLRDQVSIMPDIYVAASGRVYSGASVDAPGVSSANAVTTRFLAAQRIFYNSMTFL
jgi:hypothetical protein